ncbi:MAG: hypothetical protein H6747_05085 [Deltaproteobacteria bacterium]|nr:hypothetical protein [Deltaproteobacteria bacterium]
MRRRFQHGLAGALLLSTLASAGCSTFFVRPAPPEPLWSRLPDASCTYSRLWPAIDAVLALAVLGRFVLLPPDGGTGGLSTEDKVTLGAGVAAFGTGAVVGFARTGRCHAYDAYRRRTRWLDPPPGTTPGTPPPPGQLPESVQPPGEPADPGDGPPAPDAFPHAARPTIGASIVSTTHRAPATFHGERLVRPAVGE